MDVKTFILESPISIDLKTYDEDDRDTPSFMQNCWISGNIASNESTALCLYGCFVNGSYAQDGEYMSDIVDSVILGHNSFDLPYTDLTSSRYIKNSWVLGTNCFGMKTRSGIPTFEDSVIYGKGAFRANPTAGNVVAYRTRFVGVGTNWTGIADASANKFFFCQQIATSITNHSSTIISFCTDVSGLPIP